MGVNLSEEVDRRVAAAASAHIHNLQERALSCWLIKLGREDVVELTQSPEI